MYGDKCSNSLYAILAHFCVLICKSLLLWSLSNFLVLDDYRWIDFMWRFQRC